ncbi:hypothetical protein BS50DRAFT_640870 [Corynespora cassiicola Philippines]|uniref:Uncharacterized protein n=1 Tax=Corynespora cassiicola Philippines TaxID=1448308 RepID=A0A2T2N276_CORCC|nr:hypothetical protein BS50DRAFT_640870 [Corynespora cassiicola Philippines]
MRFLVPPARGMLYWPVAMAMLVVHSTGMAKLTPPKFLAGYATLLVVSVLWESLYKASLERGNGRPQEAIVATRMLTALLRQEAGRVAELLVIEFHEFREQLRPRPAINVDDTVD